MAPLGARLSSPGARRRTAAARFFADPDRLPAVSPHRAGPTAVAGGREAGVFFSLSGVPVPVDRAHAARPACGKRVDRRRPGPDGLRHRAGLGPAPPAWAAARDRAARPRRQRADRLSLQLLHRPGDGRARAGTPGPATDGGADRRERAAGQPGGRVADGTPWRALVRPGDRAQSAHHRHRPGPDGQPGRPGPARLAATHALAHRRCAPAPACSCAAWRRTRPLAWV